MNTWLLSKKSSRSPVRSGKCPPLAAHMESIRGWTIKTAFIPMNSTVSGDYFNITHLPPDKLADNSGRIGSRDAAALTTMQIDLFLQVKASLR